MKILQFLFSTAIFVTLGATQSFSDDLNFVGDWRNVDTSTRDLTRINIFPVNQTFVQVRGRAFGRCHPSNCDWGTEDAHGGPDDRTLIVRYPAKAQNGTVFAQRKLTLTFDGASPPTRINYLLNTHYVDFSGRPDWIRRGQLRLP